MYFDSNSACYGIVVIRVVCTAGKALSATVFGATYSVIATACWVVC
jgi:hypothetical protein